MKLYYLNSFNWWQNISKQWEEGGRNTLLIYIPLLVESEKVLMYALFFKVSLWNFDIAAEQGILIFN